MKWPHSINIAIILIVVGIVASPYLLAAAPSSPMDNVAAMAERGLTELRKPLYGLSRCRLSITLSADNATVAVAADNLFSSGDLILGIGGAPLDDSSKTPVRDLLLKHGPTDDISVSVRRGKEDKTLSVKCQDAKPYYDAITEGLYAASKHDAGACADKLEAASSMGPLSASVGWFLLSCREGAGRIASNALPQQIYEIFRQLVIESKVSPDALGRIRGSVLSAVDTLNKDNANILADDLRKTLDDAVAASSQK